MYGRYRLANGKSFEGFAGFVVGTTLFHCLIHLITGWRMGINVLFGISATAFMEMLSEELDNYILPMYLSCMVILALRN